MKEEKQKQELKRAYKIASKISGRYKSLFNETSRFTIGLLDMTVYEEALALCEVLEKMLAETDIFD